MTPSPIENDTLALLKEIRPLLGNSIDSLGGKQLQFETYYLAWGAVQVNRAVGGYCELRAIHHITASKLLIRPIMETVFSMVAALHNPVFLLKKAHAEHKEDLKLVDEQEALCRKMSSSEVSDLKRKELLDACIVDRQAIKKAYAEFELEFAKAQPTLKLKREKLSAKDAADDAGLGAWYGKYRTYCQFTHGALRAMAGDLDPMTDESDNLAVIWLSLITLTHLKDFAPTSTMDLSTLWTRANALLP